MKLATAADVLAKMGISSEYPDNVMLAESGLETATIQIQNTLNSELDVTETADYFSYVPSRYDTLATYAPLKLIASRGFWTDEPVVHYAAEGNQLPRELTDDTVVDPSWYSYDPVQGTIELLVAPYSGIGTIAVVYPSGYADEATSIPDWLRQAAIAYAIQNMQLTGVGYNKKELQDKSTEQTRLAYSLLSSKIRTRHGLYPVYSVAQ